MVQYQLLNINKNEKHQIDNYKFECSNKLCIYFDQCNLKLLFGLNQRHTKVY
jgi:hypothetical protein